MKKILLILSSLFIICSAQSQDTKAIPAKNTNKKAEVKHAALSQEEMQQKWMEYMTPGKMHQWISSTDGTWEGDIKMWMSPDAPPTELKGTATFKTILGGRYQEGVHTGEMMGMPFEGRSTLAYDNAKKVFISTWIDNMGTGVMTMEGTFNPATKTMKLKGTMVDPNTGKDCPVREVVTFLDENTQKMEMYCTMNGKETKSMEMISRRKM